MYPPSSNKISQRKTNDWRRGEAEGRRRGGGGEGGTRGGGEEGNGAGEQGRRGGEEMRG